jgi:serine/threonine protein kinase
MLEKYRIEAEIGRGGMGVVLEAWHLQLDERVAIKFLLPELGANEEAIARFEREARALFKIKSEHVCRVLDVGKLADENSESGIPYMVMEYLDGQDLASVLMQQRGLPVKLAVTWSLQVCQALAEAHSRGIVHRDLKPENLFLSERRDGSGCVKLLDFGLSKVLEEQDKQAPRERKLTSHQRVMGTPNYMSPEQWMSASDVGPAADQWATAVIIYELIAGVVPFHAESMPQICSKVLHEATPPLADMRSDVPAGLDAVLQKALEKRPEQRYDNIGSFAVALARFGGAGATAEAQRCLSMVGHAPARSSQLPMVPAPSDSGEASDMQATVPPQFDLGAAALASAANKPQRAVTAQSWQQVLVDAPGQRSRTAVVAAFGAMAALLVVAVVAVALSGPDTSESAGASATTASAAVAKPATSPPISTDDETNEDVEAAAVASSAASAVASSAPSANTAAKVATKPPIVRRKTPALRPRPRKKRAEKVPAKKPKKRDPLFDDR